MENIIEWLPLIVAALVIIAGLAIYIAKFKSMPKDKQIASVKEWLIWATAEAEKQLGSGTGKLKLRYVYDLFITKFAWLGKLITFDDFSKMVDEALVTTNRLIATNKAVADYVGEEAPADAKENGNTTQE